MKTSLKDQASVRYRDMKRKLDKKVASIQRQVVRLDADLTVRAKKRAEQLAVTLERSAERVRAALR